MDKKFDQVRAAAYVGDFDSFVSLLEATPDLITATSSDTGDSPNLIQFIVVDGGLGKIDGAARFLTYLIEHGSTTEGQLVAAASVNARELVDVLLDVGLAIEGGGRWTALDETLYWGNTDLAEYLISERGAEVTTLLAAAALDRVDLMEMFFVDGSLVSAALPLYGPWGPVPQATLDDVLGQACIVAVRNRQFAAVEYLLNAGFDINTVPLGHHEESSVLHQAANFDDQEMADWLIDRGATAESKDRRFNATAIEWAAHEGNPEMAAHLKQRLG